MYGSYLTNLSTGTINHKIRPAYHARQRCLLLLFGYSPGGCIENGTLNSSLSESLMLDGDTGRDRHFGFPEDVL